MRGSTMSANFVTLRLSVATIRSAVAANRERKAGRGGFKYIPKAEGANQNAQEAET